MSVRLAWRSGGCSAGGWGLCSHPPRITTWAAVRAGCGEAAAFTLLQPVHCRRARPPMSPQVDEFGAPPGPATPRLPAATDTTVVRAAIHPAIGIARRQQPGR